MQLTRHTDYALRLLIHLGRHPGELCQIAEVAQAQRISRTHLMKVAHNLVRAGYLEGIRGRGGGIRLARAPEDINLAKVIRATEPGSSLVDCSGCSLLGGCQLPRIFCEAMDSFNAVLARYSLADLLAKESFSSLG